MDVPEVFYEGFSVEKELADIYRLTIKARVKDNNRSTERESWLQVNRIPFDVELHSAKDPSTSIEIGSLGTFDSLGPVTLTQGDSSYVFFSIPLSPTIIEKMLEIRDKDEKVAFKIRLTIAATYYHKQQGQVIVSDILQSQGMLWENTREGKTSLILIPEDKISQILCDIQYTEIMRFEIPLYSGTSTNDSLKKSVALLKHAARLLEQGKNEGALLDVRKTLTNHLLAEVLPNSERILDKSIRDDWMRKSPRDITAIYEDILLRIQEGLRAALKIANKFSHDDKTISMPPMRRDVEFLYFNVAQAVKRLID